MIEEIKQLTELEETFDNTIDFGSNKIIHFRKWKAKDRREFVKAIKVDNKDKISEIKKLVYKTIKENIHLSKEEFLYVLSELRRLSVGDELDITWTCTNCMKINTNVISISSMYKLLQQNLSTIGSDIKVHLQTPSNYELLKEAVSYAKLDEDVMFAEFLYHIKSIEYKGDTYTIFTFEELIRFIDSIPSNIYNELLIGWNLQRFMFTLTTPISCECGKTSNILVDDISGFVEDWL